MVTQCNNNGVDETPGDDDDGRHTSSLSVERVIFDDQSERDDVDVCVSADDDDAMPTCRSSFFSLPDFRFLLLQRTKITFLLSDDLLSVIMATTTI